MKDKDLQILVGKNIHHYRNRLGLTQEQLSELVDCHPTYVGMIERGERNMSFVAAAKFAAALQISLDDLTAERQ